MRWLILVVNVTQPQLRSNLHQVDLQRIVWITNWCWRAQPTVGSTIYRKVGLGRVETLTTQISVEEPASSIPPCLCFSSCLGSCPDFPQWRSTICKSKMKHTPPHTHTLAFVHGVLSQQGKSSLDTSSSVGFGVGAVCMNGGPFHDFPCSMSSHRH